MLRVVISSVIALGITASPSAGQSAAAQTAPSDSAVSVPQNNATDTTMATRPGGAPRPVSVLSVNKAKANGPDAPQPSPRVNDHGAKLMIFGGVAILVGAVVGGSAGWIISVGGACIGLYDYLDLPQLNPETIPERFALVLGGGGLKGFAHIGVLRALEERGLRPAVICGTSIGSLIGAAYLGGMSIDEMERRALALTKRDLFRLDHLGMMARRMRNRSLYLEAPLRRLVDSVVPNRPFDSLPVPMLVNTVDIERGSQVVWGLPGMRHVSVAEAVYASCALPGFFPPARIDGRLCVDGSVMDNLPVTIAANNADAVIAVDVGSTSITISRQLQRRGFAAIYIRSAQIMMHSLEAEQLARWGRPPMLLVRPAIWQLNWFTFTRTREMIAAGYTATHETLDRGGTDWILGRGVYPRRHVEVTVDRAECIGCGLCAVLAPQFMKMDDQGKAEVVKSPLEWSRAEGDFVHQCPTDAIHVTVVEGETRRPTVQLESYDDGDEITD